MSRPASPVLEVVSGSPLPADVVRDVVDGVRRLALQRDALGLAGAAAETAADLVAARRAHTWLVDAEGGLLWCADRAEQPCDGGIVGHAVRTARAAVVRRAEADPRYVRDIDDPDGSGDEQLLVVPLVDGETHAVVVAVREAHARPFEAVDVEALALWARHAAPLFALADLAHASEESVQEVLGPAEVYRDEALAHAAGAEDVYAPLAAEDGWIARAHWVVVGAVALGVGFAALAPVTEYASGPAYVVPTARDVVGARPGVVDTVLVRVGEQVTAGQVLLTLAADAERAEQARARAVFDRALLARLRSPADRALERAVAEARDALHHADHQVEGAAIRAPAAGRVGDLRAAPGRAVDAGEVVATLRDGPGERPLVRAVVPGRHRPALAVGEPLSLRLDGFAQAPLRLTVAAVGDRVVSGGDLRGLVGPAAEGADDGAWVVVEAELPSPVLVADGRAWTLHDGMVGRADVAVRRKSLLFALFPALERAVSRG